MREEERGEREADAASNALPDNNVSRRGALKILGSVPIAAALGAPTAAFAAIGEMASARLAAHISVPIR